MQAYPSFAQQLAHLYERFYKLHEAKLIVSPAITACIDFLTTTDLGLILSIAVHDNHLLALKRCKKRPRAFYYLNYTSTFAHEILILHAKRYALYVNIAIYIVNIGFF